MQNNIITEKNFNTFHLTTTKYCGNMKNTDERELFCKSVGIDSKNIVFATQVHGTSVKTVSALNCKTFTDSCDGLITNDKTVILCIFTADCMPIFMASKDYSVVALIHAGWRGLAGGIIENATAKFLKDFNVSSQDIISYIGPHILQCCYKVGADLIKAFNATSNEHEQYFSLSVEAQKQLEKLGIKTFYTTNHCTCHEYEMFYSYRKERTDKRMMSLISCKKD